MRAVHLTAFGNPVDGLEFVDISEPDAPGPNQVLTESSSPRSIPTTSWSRRASIDPALPPGRHWQ